MLPKTLTSFLWHFVSEKIGAFSILAGTALVWSLNEAVFPYFLKEMVNRAEAFEGRGSLWQALSMPLWGMGMTWCAMEVSMRLYGYIHRKNIPAFRARIRMRLFEYAKEHSHEFFANNFAGSLANKLNDMPRASEQIIDIIIFYVIAIFSTFMISVFLLGQVSLFFAALMIGWFLAHMGVTLYFNEEIQNSSRDHAEAVSMLSGKMVDVFTNSTAMRLFARGRYEGEYIKNFQEEERRKGETELWVLEKANIVRGFLSLLFVTLTIYLLVYGRGEGWITLGDFSLIGFTVFNVMGLVWYLSMQLTDLFREIGTAQAALSLINVAHEVVDAPDAEVIKMSRGEIVFDRVTFRYKRNQNLFEEKSITLKAGQKVGVVGYSGSGKTTFVNLILRLFDIHGGRILIDGQDIAKVTQDSLRENISLIPQDPTLFHRTLSENIRYGKLEATEEETIEAAKKAHAHDFIGRLSDGYATEVGERGLKLSGGQRQRIAIARAFLKNAPILILDEATSALDSVTEQKIQESLTDLMRGRTTIVIAHRLSTLQDMDRILVFDQGDIVQDGTMETLLKDKHGLFATLWQRQIHGVIPERSKEEEDV